MKRAAVRLAMAVSVTLASIFALGAPAQADTLFANDNVCAFHGASTTAYCLNNWFANPYAFKQVRIFQYSKQGEPNNDWNVWLEGYVSATRNWPFTGDAGIQLNSRYNGSPVYKYAWAPNGKGSGWCIDQRSFQWAPAHGPAVLQPCQPTTDFPTYQYFVNAPGSIPIAVIATQTEYDHGANVQIALTTTATANGNYVTLDQLGTADQNWYLISKP